MRNPNADTDKFNWRNEYEKLLKHNKELDAKVSEYEDRIEDLEDEVEDLDFKHSILENTADKLYDRACKAESEVKDLKAEVEGYQRLLSLIARNI